MFAAALLAVVLAACGGGGSGVDATPLPASIGIAPSADVATLGSAVAFATNASGDFAYHWSFGDGATSTEAAPNHTYTRAGVYVVTLTVRNRDGATAIATASVSVADRAIVQGKLCSAPAESGWCWQQPLPQGNSIRAFDFVDDSVAYGVGWNGQILKSTDAGASWRGQYSGTTVPLAAVAFANAQVGWVAGDLGEVLRTVDGGASWERLSSGHTESVLAIGAVDANRAWIVTGYNTVLVTRDGGRQWAVLALPEGAMRIVGLSDSEFWLLPYSFNGGGPSALHTVDGGATWTRVVLPPTAPGFSHDALDLQFVDAAHALYARTESGPDAGGAYVYRRQAFVTADGGASWQLLPPPSNADAGGRYLLAAPGTVYWTQPYVNPVRTTDAGASWQPITLPPPLASIYDPQLRAFGADRLLASDYYGPIYLSVDAGATWSGPAGGGPGQQAMFNSVWFFDAREGVAWGDDGSSARTTDGGLTWSVTAPVIGTGWRRGQFSADGSVGWIVSDNGTIYRSTDKGRSWFAQAPQTAMPMFGVQDLHFIDALHGWAVSPYGPSSGSSIWISSDGGLTWQLPSGSAVPYGFVSVRFADALNGVAVGPPGLAGVTSDGGLTWTPRPTGVYSLWRVTFADANTAIAVGDSGTIVRSIDRGQSWTVVHGPTYYGLYDVRFVSSTVGHAVGDGGTVLVTRDAGLTWSAQESGATQSLRGVFFVDEMTGWATGQSGSILATATGGR